MKIPPIKTNIKMPELLKSCLENGNKYAQQLPNL